MYGHIMHGIPIYLIFIYMKPDFGQTRCGWGCSMQIWHSVTYVINVLCKCTCVVCYGVKYVHTEQGGGEELIFILSVVIVQWCTVLLQWGPLQTFIIPVFIIVLIIFIVIPSGSAGRLQGHPFLSDLILIARNLLWKTDMMNFQTQSSTFPE